VESGCFEILQCGELIDPSRNEKSAGQCKNCYEEEKSRKKQRIEKRNLNDEGKI
jgi:hypothetical protein